MHHTDDKSYKSTYWFKPKGTGDQSSRAAKGAAQAGKGQAYWLTVLIGKLSANSSPDLMGKVYEVSVI